MITKFEDLDEEIQVLVKVYYSSAVMVNNALIKIYSLENVDKEKFSKACDSDLLQLFNMIKPGDAETKKFYQDF